MRVSRHSLRLFALFVAFIAGGGTLWLIMHDHDSRRPQRADIEIPIPEPHWGDLAQAAPKHIRSVREKLDAAKTAERTSLRDLAKSYGDLGKVYLAYDLPASAVPCFQNASRLDQEEFRWPYLEAVAARDMLETQASADAMAEALKRQRGAANIPTDYRVAALCFLGEAKLRLTRLEEARSCFNEALRLAPTTVFALFKRGQLAALAGDSLTAIDDFQHALSLSPRGPPKPLVLALALEMQKLDRTQEAARYRTLAASCPDDVVIKFSDPLQAEVEAMSLRPSAVVSRAQAAVSRGNLAEALTQIEAGLEMSPESGDLRLLRAQAMLRMHRIPEAIDDLEAVKRHSPDDEVGRMLLIDALAARPETAERSLSEALAWRDERPNSLLPQLAVAALTFQQGQYKEALDLYQEASALFPQELGPRIGATTARCALGGYEEAGAEFESLMKSFPESLDVKHQFARFLATCPDPRIRNPLRGLTLIQDLLSSHDSVALGETLVCALAATGRMDDARRVMKELSAGLATQADPAMQARLKKIGEALDRGEPWTERWPFADTNGDQG